MYIRFRFRSLLQIWKEINFWVKCFLKSEILDQIDVCHVLNSRHSMSVNHKNAITWDSAHVHVLSFHGAMHMCMYYQVSLPNLISSQNYKCVQLGLSELSWIKIIEINWWCYTFYLQYDWNKWTFISSEHLNCQILLFLQLALAAGLHTTTWGKVTTILSENWQC